MISLSIDLNKIDNKYVTPGKNGARYLRLTLHEKKNEKYGDDGFVTQSVSKEEREKGVKGPIVGNYRDYGTRFLPKQPKEEDPPWD